MMKRSRMLLVGSLTLCLAFVGTAHAQSHAQSPKTEAETAPKAVPEKAAEPEQAADSVPPATEADPEAKVTATTPTESESKPSPAESEAAPSNDELNDQVAPTDAQQEPTTKAKIPAQDEGAADDHEASESEDGYLQVSDKALVPTEEPPKRMSFDVMLDLTVPLGKTSDFISKVGLQGFAVSFRYYLTRNMAVGAGASFDGLSKKDTATAQYNELTITSTHTKQLSFTPLLAKVFYAFRGKSKLEPYVALGAGAALSSQRLVTGYSAITDSYWHFAASPEVGAHFDIGQLVLLAAARLTYLPASGGSVSHTFANFSVGVAIQ